MDGGGWVQAVCTGAGAVIGFVVACNSGVGLVAGTGLVLAGAYCGYEVGGLIEQALAN